LSMGVSGVGWGVCGGEEWGVEGDSTRLVRLENGMLGDPLALRGMNSCGCTTFLSDTWIGSIERLERFLVKF